MRKKYVVKFMLKVLSLAIAFTVFISVPVSAQAKSNSSSPPAIENTAGNWTSDGNHWRFVNPDGTDASGQWVAYNNAWYYIKDNGNMADDEWIQDGNLRYFIKPGGVMESNKWTYKDDAWHYFKASGSLASNEWVQYGQSWYWFKADGKMAAGETLIINGVSHTFHKGGAWVTPSENPAASTAPIIVGDSITVNASPSLYAAIPYITIDARAGRVMSEGYNIIMSLQASGKIRETVIVALGANTEAGTDSYIQALINNLNPGHRLLFVVPYSTNGGYETAYTYPTANFIRSLPGTYDFITIADFAAAAYDNPHLIDADKIHLSRNQEGRNLFASTVADGLEIANTSPLKS